MQVRYARGSQNIMRLDGYQIIDWIITQEEKNEYSVSDFFNNQLSLIQATNSVDAAQKNNCRILLDEFQKYSQEYIKMKNFFDTLPKETLLHTSGMEMLDHINNRLIKDSYEEDTDSYAKSVKIYTHFFSAFIGKLNNQQSNQDEYINAEKNFLNELVKRNDKETNVRSLFSIGLTLTCVGGLGAIVLGLMILPTLLSGISLILSPMLLFSQATMNVAINPLLLAGFFSSCAALATGLFLFASTADSASTQHHAPYTKNPTFSKTNSGILSWFSFYPKPYEQTETFLNEAKKFLTTPALG